MNRNLLPILFCTMLAIFSVAVATSRQLFSGGGTSALSVVASPTPLPARPRPAYTPLPTGTVSPVVIQRSPEQGEELRPDGIIEIVFDREMNGKTVEPAFSLSPAVKGVFEWADGRTLRFHPAQELKRGGLYDVVITQEAQAKDGAPLAEPYAFRFFTTGFLEVSQVVPAKGTGDVEPTGVLLTVIFNRPVVPLTSLSEQAKLPNPLTLDPPAEGKGEWLNTSIYTFAPDKPLAGGTSYTARIKGGLTDTTGGLLAEDYTWSFTTAPPEVTWTNPTDGDNLVPVEQAITVQFNQDIDQKSAGNSFYLYDARGLKVSGDLRVAGNTLTFTPTQRLKFGEGYRAIVKAGITNVGGGKGMRQDRSWRFSAVPLPRIVKTRPADGDKDANSYTNFSIEFNAPIDPATVMPNISMTPPLSPTQVYTYTGNRNMLFNISFGAQPSTDYRVDIGPSIADPYGNKTGQTTVVRFRTAPLRPSLRLHVPDLIGTYNAYEPARLYVSFVNVNRVDLKLYRLDADEILGLQRNWHDYKPSSGPIRSWSKSLESPLNKTAYAPVDLVEGGGKLEPGLYLLDAEAPEVESGRWGTRHIFVVSRLNLTLKSGEREALAWATDLSSGEPAGGISLTFYDENTQQELGKSTTGENGLAHVKIGQTDRGQIVVMSTDPFSAIFSDWSQGVRPWDFGLDASYDLREYNLHVYTERPIYRPGQKVDFRGVLRAEDDVRYSLPTAGQEVQVIVNAPNGEQVHDQKLKLNEFGAFSGELTLAEGAPLGDYRIGVEFQGRSFGAGFQVAAYRPPEFEVAVKPDRAETVRGEKAGASVEVQYFFGGPVANAPVSWNVLAENYYFKPPWGGRYQFTDSDDPWICFDCWWYRPEPQKPVLSGSGTTDAQGRLRVEIPADLQVSDNQGRPITGSLRLTIEATVTGRDNQVISGRESVTLHRGDFYVGLAPQKYVGKEGEPLAVDLVAVDWQGTRLPKKDVSVSFYRREWTNTFVANEAGGGAWKTETKDTLVDTVKATTDDKGEAVASFTPPSGGSYRAVAESLDAGGRTVRSSLFVWVTGKEHVSWRRENNDRINLIADKSSYLPGETAQILIPSPYEGTHYALLTVERGGILYREVIKMTSNSQVYSLTLTTDYAPNVYVSAVLIKGQKSDSKLADYKVGYVPLEVKPLPQTIQVRLTPDRTKAGPGESVTYRLEAADSEGKPVRAEFSLDLVDKAVLSLQPRQPEAIVQAFYGRLGLGIQTSSGLAVSINRYLQELEKDLGIEKEKEEAAQMRGGGPAPAATAAPGMAFAVPMAAEAPESAKKADAATAAVPANVEVREEFADTAYWNASVITDKEGKASVTVKLPDNLTTWVMRGVGLTADTRVGEGTADVVATRPLLVRPVAPRFFVVGDRARLGAAVNNNTDGPLSVEVTLSAKGVGLLSDSARQTVRIDAGKEAKVNWDVVVSDVTQAELIFSAVSGEYSDASKPRLATGPDGSLLVLRYSAPEVVGTAGQLSEAGSRTEVVALPPRYNERQGELSIQLDPSLAAGMRDGLKYLEHYPYECTEQTVSRFLPNVLTYRALHDLGISDPELEARLPGLVKTGVDRLVSQQNEDGGWGWWALKESNPHLSAYVLFGLLKARRADFAVPEETINRGVAYLKGKVVSAKNLNSYVEANKQAFILYVLAEAGQPQRSAVNDLFERRSKLYHYGKAFLALTISLDDPKDGRIKTLLSDLNNAAIMSATGVHWEEDGYDWWAMNTDTRSTAVILDALARLDKDNALAPNVVRWLMVARKEGIWETTQETAWALIGLTDWMVATGELKAEYDYSVVLNKEELKSGNVTTRNVGESVKLKVAVADLLRDVSNRLTIEKGQGPGRLYYTAHLKVYLPVEEIKAVDRGIIVSRRYTLASCDKGAACPEVREARVGDVIRVDLTIIAPNDLYYVVVEDPLPAGAEAIDPTLATTSLLDAHPSLRRQAQKPYWEEFYRWWWNWYSRSELRDEKVVLFADYLSKGTYQYSYTMRATLPGDYKVIPTVASEFYFPEVFGRGDGRLLSIGGE